MKKIIILSDTHKNQQTLKNVFEIERKYTHIIHLGDNYEDLNNNSDITENIELIRVPGIYHPGYKDGTLPIILKIEIDNWKLALAHRLEDILKNSIPADIYLYGHTHHSYFNQVENKYFINPGHLKAKTDRGQKASYIVLTIENNNAEIQFKHLDGKIFRHKQINKL
jgi:uncharacterized protein